MPPFWNRDSSDRKAKENRTPRDYHTNGGRSAALGGLYSDSVGPRQQPSNQTPAPSAQNHNASMAHELPTPPTTPARFSLTGEQVWAPAEDLDQIAQAEAQSPDANDD